jgi:dephospho-CoA kinase
VVIAVAGEIGSGKTTVARALAQALDCQLVSFGSYIRSLAGRTNPNDLSRHNLQQLSDEIMASIGPAGLTKSVLTFSGWNRTHSLVIDGIRHPDVLAEIRNSVAPMPVFLIYIDVLPELRYQRVAARDALSRAELAVVDSHSTERDVSTKIRELADLVIAGNRSAEELAAEVINAILPGNR